MTAKNPKRCWAPILGLAVATLLIAGSGCLRRAKAAEAIRCAENRELSCVTQVECSFDEARGCDVCRCASVRHGPQVPGPNQQMPADPARQDQRDAATRNGP